MERKAYGVQGQGACERRLADELLPYVGGQRSREATARKSGRPGKMPALGKDGPGGPAPWPDTEDGEASAEGRTKVENSWDWRADAVACRASSPLTERGTALYRVAWQHVGPERW